MEALQLRPGERVVDLACGGAKATVAAARAVGPSGQAVGVDIAQGMIDLAKRRRDEAKLDNIELAICDVQVDAFPSAPFDAALSQFGIMFFDEPIRPSHQSGCPLKRSLDVSRSTLPPLASMA
jgi:ubiquinone/menaquinone biosynthesis C-methylase UbiE